MVLGYLVDINTAEGSKPKKIREMEKEFSALIFNSYEDDMLSCGFFFTFRGLWGSMH